MAPFVGVGGKRTKGFPLLSVINFPKITERAKTMNCKAWSLCFVLSAAIACGDELKIAGWNVESGGARLSGLTPVIEGFDDCAVWGFCEVRGQDWVAAFEEACEAGETASFSSVVGTTGGTDLMAIVFNDEKLELVGTWELHAMNPGGNVRAPLVAHFKIRESGIEFNFMVNHLYRSRADARHQQASQLNEWAGSQEIPVIAVGDYNFDWEVQDGELNHDEGFDLMTAADIFTWRRPEELIKTQDSRYDSVLDFVFTSGGAKQWPGGSQIIVREGDFPDSEETSDHRPVIAWFEPGQAERAARRPVPQFRKPAVLNLSRQPRAEREGAPERSGRAHAPGREAARAGAVERVERRLQEVEEEMEKLRRVLEELKKAPEALEEE